jgi:hypothetical protein
MSLGQIHRLMSFVEQRHSTFAVTRLIMVTGVNLRAFGPDADDDPEVLQSLHRALPRVLSAEEAADAERESVQP